jgi:hypothetical protein
MSQFNRWNHAPDVAPQGDEFLASSAAFPGVFGEGETREEAIDSFWEMVDFIGGLARAPNWPHDRSPYVDAWETIDDETVGSDKEQPTGTEDDLAEDEDHFTVNDDDEEEDDLPPWSPEPWRPE